MKRRRKLVERIQHSNYTREKLKVIVKYVSTPDADIRISRAINMLMEADKDIRNECQADKKVQVINRGV